MSISTAYSQVAFCVLTVVLAFCFQTVYRFKAQNTYQQVTLVPGLPLLGNTISLATQGAGFIHKCRRLHGDIFRLKLAGQSMTYLLSPANIKLFFTAPDEQIAFRQVEHQSSGFSAASDHLVCQIRPATEHFTQRVFGLPSQLFFPHHSALLQRLRLLLTPAELPARGKKLVQLMQHHGQSLKSNHGKLELMTAVKDVLFPAAVESLFGEQFLQHHSVAHLQQAFFAFEAGFELAASPMPHWLQRGFCRARQSLLNAFRISLAAGHFEGTTVGELLDSVPELHTIAPNVLLALLWASLANSIPASFWALAFLLLPENQHYKHKVLASLQKPDSPPPPSTSGQEVESAEHTSTQQQPQPIHCQMSLASQKPDVSQQNHRLALSPVSAAESSQLDGTKQQDCDTSNASHVPSRAQAGMQGPPESPDAEASNYRLVEVACDRQSLLAGCVAEAMRLRAPGVAVRMATADLDLPADEGSRVHIAKGDMLAVSPFETHRDPRLFQPAASQYIPDRPGMLCPHSRLHEVPGVGGIAGLVFGGGRYRCPGRFFAEMEVALTLAFFLTQFKPSLCSALVHNSQQQCIQQHKKKQQAVHEKSQVDAEHACCCTKDQTSDQSTAEDPNSFLPIPETRRQVGIRWPQAPCEVVLQPQKHQHS